MAEVAMAAAMTRSQSVTDSPILTGTDAKSSPVGAAGDRVGFPSPSCQLCLLLLCFTSFIHIVTIQIYSVAVQRYVLLCDLVCIFLVFMLLYYR